MYQARTLKNKDFLGKLQDDRAEYNRVLQNVSGDQLIAWTKKLVGDKIGKAWDKRCAEILQRQKEEDERFRK